MPVSKKRRRKADAPRPAPSIDRSLESLEEGARVIREEGGGMFGLFVVQPLDVPGLLTAAAAGSKVAHDLVRATTEMLLAVDLAGPDERFLCGTCDDQVRKGLFWVTIARPPSDRATRAVVTCICRACAPDADAALEKAQVAARGIFPDARTIHVTHPEGGHA